MRFRARTDRIRFERLAWFQPQGWTLPAGVPSLVALLALLVLPPVPLNTSLNAQGGGAEWPQLGGPTRDFRIPAASIARTWPEAGPRQRWRRALGEGYSSVLVDGTTLVTMYRRGDSEVVVALDSATGKTRWEYAYPAPLTHDGYFDVWLNAAGPGPYSSPLIADGMAFAVGVTGQFHALDLRTGAVRWSRDLVSLLDGSDYNAFASSPLAYGDTVILPLGGSDRGLVAFKRSSGDIAWRGEPFALGPGSPILINVDGRPELVVWGQTELAGMDPQSGRVLWRHPHAAEHGLNISTPVWSSGNRLFASSAYGGGSRMLRLARTGNRTTPTELWANGRMRLHFGSSLVLGNLIVGSSGDFGPAFLVALNAETGAELWRERTFARAQLVDVGGTLIIVDEDGDVAVASASEAGLRVHARKTLLTSNAWTPPTVVGSTVYLRDRKEILALDLGH
ncbi:MAG: PQQ-binding-like beta-propeller repeat protein [Vicinamibacterales bacterium]